MVIRHADHVRYDFSPFITRVVFGFPENDFHLSFVFEVVERRDNAPTVHLPLVNLLGTVVQTGGIPQTDRVRRRKQPEIRVRCDNPVLIQQSQLAFHFEHPLNNEHYVRASGVVFVKHKRRRMLYRPGQHAFLELRDLLAVLQHDGVFANQIDTTDVTVQVYSDARPVEPGCNLLDMRGLTRAVIPLDHHAPVVSKTRKNRQSRIVIETIVLIDYRNMIRALNKRRHL